MAKGNVELWLGELLVIQQKSLHGVIKEGSIVVADPQFEMMGFLDKYIAQVTFFISFSLLVNLLKDKIYLAGRYYSNGVLMS